MPTPPLRLPVPIRVEMWKAKASLDAAGKLDAVNEFVEGHKSDNPVLWHFWNSATTIERNSNNLNNFASAVGMDHNELDALFIAAAKIKI